MSAQQLHNLLGMLRSGPSADDEDVAAMREGLEKMGAMLPIDPDASFDVAQIGALRAEWVSLERSDRTRVVLFLHGGGYSAGSPLVYRSFTSRLARATGARVLAVDYRLAPEHRFPAALEDALAAYRWTLDDGVAPNNLLVAGDSAGAGLAAALLICVRDRGTPSPAGAVLLSPLVDLAATGATMVENAASDPMVSISNVTANARRYLGPGGDPHNPLASPLYADLAGLPPFLIQVGSPECLLDDAKRFAARAREAGTDVTLEVWDDMFHVWQAFAAVLDEGQAAIDAIGRFAQARLGSTTREVA